MMGRIYKKKGLFLILIMGVITTSWSGVPSSDVLVLSADFDDRAVGNFIGAGGAELGEPISLGGLTGEIIESTPGDNHLLIENDLSSTSARRLRWQLLDNSEISEGIATLYFEFTPSALDSYSILVRESNTSGSGYLTYFLTPSGSITASDSAGALVLNDATYIAGETQRIELIYDFNLGTSQMIVNDVVQFSDRIHGITGDGVGALLVGYSSSSAGSSFTLDNIAVTDSSELPIILDANFEGQVLGQPIGTGGPVNGEPVSISNNLFTEIVEYGMNNQGLYQDSPSSSSAFATVWEFLDDIEVKLGVVAIELDIEFAQLGSYAIGLRENGSSGTTFANLRFAGTGSMFIADGNGNLPLVGVTYEANQRYRIRMTFDFENASYKVFKDNQLIVDDREIAVNNGRGIGRLIIQNSAGGDDLDAFIIDDLQVGTNYISIDTIFKDGFE